MSSLYPLQPLVVREIIENRLAGRPYNQEQFMYYHLHRNHFNVKGEVTQLTKTAGGNFLDNLGHTWEEVSTLKNYFHMPTANWVASTTTFGLVKPYSRKFLRDDNVTGVMGEFEMIIRHDGKRIDALTHETYQETYNFGRTRNTSQHIDLDVNPHRENPNYEIRINTGRVSISE